MIFFYEREEEVEKQLLLHEKKHLEQYKKLGFIRFMRIYLGEYFFMRFNGCSHYYSYYNISLEIKARQAEKI